MVKHAIKSYNDSLMVYEAKLADLGITCDELNFEIIESETSSIPAGLVTKQ